MSNLRYELEMKLVVAKAFRHVAIIFMVAMCTLWFLSVYKIFLPGREDRIFVLWGLTVVLDIIARMRYKKIQRRLNKCMRPRRFF